MADTASLFWWNNLGELGDLDYRAILHSALLSMLQQRDFSVSASWLV